MRTVICLFAMLVAVATADGQFRRSSWGSGSCDQFDCDVEPAPAWEWKSAAEEFTNGTNRYSLWRHGRFVGFWDLENDYYRSYLGGDNYGQRIDTPPVPVASWILKMKNAKPSGIPPDGVDVGKLRGRDECECHINGKEEKVGFQALVAALDDDSQKLWLVVTGDGRDAFIAKVKSDPKLADLLSRCRIWSAPDGHHSLLDRDTKKPMFPNGSPGLFLGQADGTELYKASGPTIDLEALRKSDPLFRPDPPKKPDPPPLQPLPTPPAPKPPNITPDPMPMPPASPMPMCCLAALGGAVFTYVVLKQKQ